MDIFFLLSGMWELSAYGFDCPMSQSYCLQSCGGSDGISHANLSGPANFLNVHYILLRGLICFALDLPPYFSVSLYFFALISSLEIAFIRL